MRLEISTACYGGELMKWANDNHISINECESGEGFFACVFDGSDPAGKLCLLLEDLILISNEVVKSSGNIKQHLRRIVFSHSEKDLLYEIGEYIKCNDRLNLDGYLTFRLKKYRETVDIILYAAIKKVLY